MLFIFFFIAIINAECTERRMRKFPAVFKDCETQYDEYECLTRKAHYLKENECTETEEYKTIQTQLETIKPNEEKCTYIKDYECRIIHSGCLDVVSLNLGGSKEKCLTKFMECLSKAHCEHLPMYIQAKDILDHPENYKEQLKVVLKNQDQLEELNDMEKREAEREKKEKEKQQKEEKKEEKEIKEINEETMKKFDQQNEKKEL